MKNINIISAFMASAILVSSCGSYAQLSAGTTGAMMGSRIGSTIGFLSGGMGRHYNGRSEALGSLIGMGVGAAVGVGIANSIENKAKQGTTYSASSGSTSSSSNYSTDDYQIGGSSSGSYSTGTNSSYAGSNSYNGTASTGSTGMTGTYLTIADPTYTDADGDGYISKGETCEIETYITNRSNTPLNNVTITISSDQEKRVTLSNPLMTTLSPGQQVHYKGRVYCSKVKKGESMQIQLTVNDLSSTVNSNIIVIPMK